MSPERDEPVEDQPMPEAGASEQRDLVEPVAVGPGDPSVHARPAAHSRDTEAVAAHDGAEGPATPATATPSSGHDPADASLLALVDRLAVVLERSELGELEVSAGGTTIVLRAPSAIERQAVVAAAPLDPGGETVGAGAGAAVAIAATPVTPAAAKPSVKAPLTGIFYAAPSPGATPYVSVGDHVSVGQIIGLIEAMKLFNEIKSDLAGRVTRVCADSGQLVKARQPLIEVDRA